jgi:hypothetical protein
MPARFPKRPKPAHYKGTYHVDSRRVRDQANANPYTRCWRCGNLAIPGDPWQAGHTHDGLAGGLLLPEHRSCNRNAGAKLGSLRSQRKRKGLNAGRAW